MPGHISMDKEARRRLDSAGVPWGPPAGEGFGRARVPGTNTGSDLDNDVRRERGPGG